jgi:hypothetical protein
MKSASIGELLEMAEHLRGGGQGGGDARDIAAAIITAAAAICERLDALKPTTSGGSVHDRK